ncbi:MAG: hypothetical protein NTY39_01080 [Campylobacterales bacterium]|jgi:hypothetical protein|nr:hypothetical protein [Campylobacterales bacterium]
MNVPNITPKILLASALLSSGLLGASPVIGNRIIQRENVQAVQDQIVPRIDSQLCNQQFVCSKTGIIVKFLPNAEALFIAPNEELTLKADYTVHFNQHIALNVYENPSKNFDLMMNNVTLYSDGFTASVNREDRYFQKV